MLGDKRQFPASVLARSQVSWRKCSGTGCFAEVFISNILARHKVMKECEAQLVEVQGSVFCWHPHFEGLMKVIYDYFPFLGLLQLARVII